jgi:hypothetical protein
MADRVVWLPGREKALTMPVFDVLSRDVGILYSSLISRGCNSHKPFMPITRSIRADEAQKSSESFTICITAYGCPRLFPYYSLFRQHENNKQELI